MTYLVADRKTSLLALTATLVMTEFNTATLISFSSLGYLAGPYALWLPAVFLIGLSFYALTVAGKWKSFNGLSVASLFTERYGRDIGIMASGALLFAMLGFSAAYVKSLSLLFAPLIPQVGPWALSSFLVVFVLVMMLRGGLISIIRTDLFSFWVMILFFPFMALFAYRYGGSGPVAIAQPTSLLPPRFVISLIFLTMFTYILAPWYGQKIFSANSRKTAFLSVLFSAVLVFILYSLAVLSTWFFRKKGVIACSPEEALPYVIAHVLPKGLRGLGYALLFAASATTLSGVWSAMTSLVVGDFFQKKGEQSYQRSMGLTLVFALSSLLLANVLVEGVFDQLILANIPVAALSFALLAGFYWKRASRVGAYVSMISGWAAGIYTYLHFGEAGGYTWYWAMWGLPAIFISGMLGSFFFPNKKEFNIIGVN